jgi:hypothetical protein
MGFCLKGLDGSESYEKISNIFNKVMGQIPELDRIGLEKKNVVVILGDKVNSYCIPLYFYQLSKEISDPIEVHIIVLSPGVIDVSVSETIYTIAHELAHAYLGHGQPVSDLNVAKNNEMEADRQVIRWGFEKELKACPHNYLLGNGVANVFKP